MYFTGPGIIELSCEISSQVIGGDVVNNKLSDFGGSSKHWIPDILSKADFKVPTG